MRSDKVEKAIHSLLYLFCSELKRKTYGKENAEYFISSLRNINFSQVRLKNKKFIPSTLEKALNNITKMHQNDRPIVKISKEISTSFHWEALYESPASGEASPRGIYVCRLVGLDGIVFDKALSIGLMLLLPGAFYPFHTHNIDEMYLGVSGELIIKHGIDGKPFKLGTGKISFTPKNCIHSLSVKGNPALILFSWNGDLTVPIWFWKRLTNKSWERLLWTRDFGEAWKVGRKELVSEKDFLKVNDT